MTRETLQPYISMADMLARTFGKECEIVLYDMTNPQHSVVYAANNTVTNCQIGDRLPSSVSQMLRSPDLKEDFISNYYFHTETITKRIFTVPQPFCSADRMVPRMVYSASIWTQNPSQV